MNKNYKIVEKFTKSKTKDERTNEDGIYLGENFVVVVDGTTSKTDFSSNGRTSGQVARDIILETMSSFNGDEDSHKVVKEIQRKMHDFSVTNKIDHLSASAVIYSCSRKEIWSIGDCQYSINGCVEQNIKEVDIVFSKVRSIAIYALQEAGYKEEELRKRDLAREYLMPFLKLQLSLENRRTKYGYCVFNGACEPELFPIEMIRATKVPDHAELILASDGYPKLGRTLAESEKNLIELLLTDPFCYKDNLSTKGISDGNDSFDDRTFLRIII